MVVKTVSNKMVSAENVSLKAGSLLTSSSLMQLVNASNNTKPEIEIAVNNEDNLPAIFLIICAKIIIHVYNYVGPKVLLSRKNTLFLGIQVEFELKINTSL